MKLFHIENFSKFIPLDIFFWNCWLSFFYGPTFSLQSTHLVHPPPNECIYYFFFETFPKEGSTDSKKFLELKKREKFHHFLIGHRGRFGRKAMIAERVIKTLSEMIRLRQIQSLKSYLSDFKTVVRTYNSIWYNSA